MNKSFWPLMLMLSLLAAMSSAQAPGNPARPLRRPSITALIGSHPTIQIFGTGPLWKRLTGINEGIGIKIRDKRISAALLSNLYLEPPRPETDSFSSYAAPQYAARFPIGSVGIDIMPFAQLSYEPSDRGEAEEMGLMERPADGLMVTLRSGHDRELQRLIHRIARKARLHGPGVSLFDLSSS